MEFSCFPYVCMCVYVGGGGVLQVLPQFKNTQIWDLTDSSLYTGGNISVNASVNGCLFLNSPRPPSSPPSVLLVKLWTDREPLAHILVSVQNMELKILDLIGKQKFLLNWVIY